jgi:ATP-binding cassette subfamily C protein CydC
MTDLRFFLSLARPDRWWLRLGAALAAITLLAGIGLLSLSGWFITAGALAGLAGAGGAFNYLFASGGVRAFALTRTVSRYGERMITHEATFRILARLRLWVFDQAAPLAPGRLSKFRGGDLLSRVTSDVDALDNLYLRLLIPAFAAACAGLATLILLAWLAPLAIPGVLGSFVLAAIVLPILTARLGQAAGEAIARASAQTRAEASDLVAGLAELKAFGGDARMISRLEMASTSWIDAQRQRARLTALNAGVLGFAAPFSFTLGLTLATLGGASIPVAALAGFVAFGLFEAAAPLLAAGELYGQTTASAHRLRELQEIEPTASDPEHPVAAPKTHSIAIRNVSFRYPDVQTLALDDVSFNLTPGSRLALVGPSGAGKSSLIKLLMSFYRPESGDITLGGTSIANLELDGLRSKFALVDQRAELLSGTVASNLRLANPDASDDELWTALEIAKAADFVRALPDQLNCWIGEQGNLVSGGQARRLVLARAILKDAPILLLDEPTEGLDALTEREFLDGLDAYLATRPETSVLMVTHRTSLVARADHIVMIERGQKRAEGPPQTLLRDNAEFAALFPHLTLN